MQGTARQEEPVRARTGTDDHHDDDQRGDTARPRAYRNGGPHIFHACIPVALTNCFIILEPDSPIETVWAALADPEAIGAWMDDDSVKFGKKVGGKYALFGGVTTGKITAIEKPSVLEYTWRQAEWDNSEPDTLVRWELQPEGKKTRLRLVHGGFIDRHNRDDHDEGWDVYFLDPMKEWLESQK